MKIGLSYSRCVRDIVDGKVDIEDVLVIISRTDFDPRVDEQWSSIWRGYNGGSFMNTAREWSQYGPEDEDQFRDISIELWERGKLHQPRQFGAHAQRMPYYWVETVLPISELESKPALKAAWDNFQVIAGLTNIKLKKEHQ